jgi:hypothetical protein
VFGFFQLCDVVEMVDHLQEDLAKFGYKQDMKIKKIQASF